MQIARKATFFLGIFIFIIPFLGFPTLWKAVFTVVSGVFLVLLSIKINIPKKSTRHKIVKEKITPVFVESEPIVSPKNDTIEVISQTAEVKPVVKRTRTRKSNGPSV